MIKFIYILTIFLMCLSSLARAEVKLFFQENYIKQGTLVPVTISVDADTLKKIKLQKLVGQTLAESIYLYELSSFIKKENNSAFEAEAQVVFIKTPQSNLLSHKSDSEEFVLSFNDIKVVETVADQEFIYGSFSIPPRANLLLWSLGFFAVLIFIFPIRWWIKKRRIQELQKKQRMKLKVELLQAKEYEEIVKVWQHKEAYFLTFPEIVPHFKDFEQVLYRYQFRPTQTQKEIQIVETSYQTFLQKSAGGLDGV